MSLDDISRFFFTPTPYLILSISFNIYQFFRNKKDTKISKHKDVLYQNENLLYQETFLKNLNKYIEYVLDAKKILYETSQKVVKNIHNEHCPKKIKESIEGKIEELDKLNNNLEYTTLAITIYSKEFYTKIRSKITTFYDSMTENISKFNSINKDNLPSKQMSILAKGQKEADEFLDEFVSLIKEHSPHY